MTDAYRIYMNDAYDPKGPDGKGRNRLGINTFYPSDRCALIPKSRQAALDTLRGMAKFGAPTMYSECCNANSSCDTCGVAMKKKDTWREGWHIREDQRGIVWLLGNVEKGFKGFGYFYKTWAGLLNDVEVPMLERHSDSQGTYWMEKQ